MIISNNNDSSYTQKSVEHSKERVQAQVANTKSTDVYESSTKSSSDQKQYGTYSASTAKPNTPQSVAHKLDLDETGVPKTYFPSWPKEIRESFWDHDKNLTLMEKMTSPSGRIKVEMTVFSHSPDNYPSELSEKDKFLAMIDDIKIKWGNNVKNSALRKDEQEMYAKALIDVDNLTRGI
jgi:hypothetical protein